MRQVLGRFDWTYFVENMLTRELVTIHHWYVIETVMEQRKERPSPVVMARASFLWHEIERRAGRPSLGAT